MIEAATIITRLKSAVPELGSVEGAMELAALMAAAPQVWAKPRAHVVPRGIRGGAVQDFAGGFVQGIEWTFAVFLTFASHGDRKGAKALDDVSAVQNAVIAALCGWAPAGSAIGGEMRLASAYLAELKPGAVVYVLEFSVPDQVRML